LLIYGVSGLRVYPNPAMDVVLIEIAAGVSAGAADVSIYAFNGILVKKTVIGNNVSGNVTQINVSKLPAGLYTVKVGASVTKFIKK
jgi:hypothetical protein